MGPRRADILIFEYLTPPGCVYQDEEKSEGFEDSADDDVSSAQLEDEGEGEDLGAVGRLLVARMKLPAIRD